MSLDSDVPTNVMKTLKGLPTLDNVSLLLFLCAIDAAHCICTCCLCMGRFLQVAKIQLR